jgi:hypothetical protein
MTRNGNALEGPAPPGGWHLPTGTRALPSPAGARPMHPDSRMHAETLDARLGPSFLLVLRGPHP